jgi:hypothetical protein
MIKQALEYLIGLGNARTLEVGAQTYSTQQLFRIKESITDPIKVNSLSGLVGYLKSNFDDFYRVMVHVDSPTEVFAFTTLNRDMDRNHLIKSNALLPHIRFDNYYNAEEFNIKLQSCFVRNDDRDIVLKVVGNIKESDVKSFGDDGVSQSVVAKTGVATVSDVIVPNPVALKPYRTFVEVEQPESNFVFRMKSGPSCAIFEADGGAWKLEAMNNISNYLQKELEEEIASGKITIIA